MTNFLPEAFIELTKSVDAHEAFILSELDMIRRNLATFPKKYPTQTLVMGVITSDSPTKIKLYGTLDTTMNRMKQEVSRNKNIRVLARLASFDYSQTRDLLMADIFNNYDGHSDDNWIAIPDIQLVKLLNDGYENQAWQIVDIQAYEEITSKPVINSDSD